MFKARGQTKSGNRADLLFEDASGQEMPSAIISRKDESISSKLEKLVKSEKSIKRKLLEYDRKYNLEDMEMAPAGQDNLLLQENRASRPFIDAEGDSANKKPSFKKSKARVDSSPKKSEEKKRLVGKYPDYLSPAVISSHSKRPQSSQSRGHKTSHREEEPYKHSGIAKRIEERVKVGKVVESKKDSREPSERRTNSKDKIEQMSKNNKHSTEEANSKYTANGTAKKYFSNYNSAYGFDLLPKTINMKINPATKMLEIIEGSQSEKQNKSITRTPTKTAAAPTMKTSSNHIPIQPPPVAPKRPISSYTSLCQGQLKMSRKSINSATHSEHNLTNQKRQTFSTIEAAESPKLCQIIKTLPETQEFKKISPYEINSFLDYSVVQRTELWLKARSEKLDNLREIKKVKDEERYRMEITPSILQSPSKSNLRYSQIESRLPAEARISTGRSLSRERGISRDSLNVSRGIKASRGYGDIYQLKKEYESTKI